MDAIILAGGFGTRLKSVVDGIPKPMAPIGDRPFLEYLLTYIIGQRLISQIFISTGYKAEVITDYFGVKYKQLDLKYIVEKKPLGTGGAILFALRHTKSNDIVVLNGDTFFDVDLNSMYNFHSCNEADLTIAAKPMTNFDRYGTIESINNKIIGFSEKKITEKGIINGGIYMIKKEIFIDTQISECFSFESDFLVPNVKNHKMMSFLSDGYFIDIGIPEDYKKAVKDFNNLKLH